jgi:hypothetical protein
LNRSASSVCSISGTWSDLVPAGTLATMSYLSSLSHAGAETWKSFTPYAFVMHIRNVNRWASIPLPSKWEL